MKVYLSGGPFDGSLNDAPSNLPLYLVVKNHPDYPVYKIASQCTNKKCSCPCQYCFIGYESNLNFQSLEQTGISS